MSIAQKIIRFDHPELMLIELVVTRVYFNGKDMFAGWARHGVEMFTRPVNAGGNENLPKHCHTVVPVDCEAEAIKFYENFDYEKAMDYLEGWQRILKSKNSAIITPSFKRNKHGFIH